MNEPSSKAGMHQNCEEEKTLEDFLKEFTNLKQKGTPCTVKEARRFYYDMWKSVKMDYVNVCSVEMMNFVQKIPITKVPKESLEYMIDDFQLMIEKATMGGMMLDLVWNLYHNPENYLAWKGELMIPNLNGEKVKDMCYYVELKDKLIKKDMGLYI